MHVHPPHPPAPSVRKASCSIWLGVLGLRSWVGIDFRVKAGAPGTEGAE
ncbi:hypothetical protein ACFVHW_04405 [Streptomyces sp. NPDC127110]